MAKSRSPNRDKAFELYKEYNGKITSKEIARRLGENVKNIQYWRSVDHWKEKCKPKCGAPYGNQNAVGNKGGKPPKRNQNARTGGWYSKYYPTVSKQLWQEMKEANDSPLEILWAQIQTLWIAVIRSQEIMHVEDHHDTTKVIKKESSGKAGDSTEYEFQYAWDKQAKFLSAQSTAIGRITSMLVKYDEMLHKNWDIATEEQKLRVQRLRQQIDEQKEDHKKKLDEEKLQLQKDRFEHQKDIDSKRYW